MHKLAQDMPKGIFVWHRHWGEETRQHSTQRQSADRDAIAAAKASELWLGEWPTDGNDGGVLVAGNKI